MSDPDYDRCDHGQRIGLDDCDKCSVIGLRSQLRRVLDERNAARTALSASEARAVAAEKRIYELEKSLLVPGVMECAKCHFYLVRTNLYVNDGTYGPGDNKTEPCPNGCGPLWPVTWKQQADEMMARCEMASARIAELEAALAAMRDERNAAGRSAHDSEANVTDLTCDVTDLRAEVSRLSGELEKASKDAAFYRSTMHAVDADGDSAWDSA